MENLLALLDKIQQVSPLPFFSQETIIVQNAGMQHWLNLSLAESRQISMNINYALPAQFLWKLLRSLVDEEDVPEQSPYSREVLSWRIYALLDSEAVIEDKDFASVNQYWENAEIKRYALSCQVADLFEQYLIFRPDWIEAWSKGDYKFASEQEIDEATKTTYVWQGKLWHALTQECAYNPNHLIKLAVNNLSDKKHLIPKRISFFGINAIAPIWLEFIHQLSSVTQVHFFHLNPCFDYWGDVTTEKQAINRLADWYKGADEPDNFEVNSLLVNPLLANLGQQGREFLAMLQEYSTINIEAFDQLNDFKAAEEMSLLAHIQRDILSLHDARVGEQVSLNHDDDSITITSSHSALREVQGLHDWLLHQFNNDPDLTPKDVIVMCPQVEHYAPYIDAVFARGWQNLDDAIPPLPCSIADRKAKDADPVVAAFLEVLSLPDSRFQVSQLISFLRLEAMQRKFAISVDEIDRISHWLNQASIHWGLNKAHKAAILGASTANETFTWKQGLSRLIRGFAYGDEDTIFQQQLVLSAVEGADGVLLGKLMFVLEQLQFYSIALKDEKTPQNWQLLLFKLIDELFDIEQENCFNDISNAIESLNEHCIQAKYEGTLSLEIVSEYLNSHFSQPEPGRQFMIGQVTFCSMVPMRSIPFKVVAILGLNDGEFPRSRQTLGFDLLSNTTARLGDRSRRGDDRYLFLEAIISARQSLYLSYQGNSIKNNAEKQPSIVLKELMDYLHLGYRWNEETLGSTSKLRLRRLPMQPFSLDNYIGHYLSFDDKWLNLANSNRNVVTEHLYVENDDGEPIEEISVDELVSFYSHPSRYFARKQLRLNLNQSGIDLEDVEPFSVNALESYQLRQAILQIQTQGKHAECVEQGDIEFIFEKARLSGKFPDLPTTESVFTGWLEDSEVMMEMLDEQQAIDAKSFPVSLVVTGDQPPIKLTTSLALTSDKAVFYRASKPNAKDKLSLYINQLILQLSKVQSTEINSDITNIYGYYFDTRSQKPITLQVEQIDNPLGKLQQLIATYLKGCQEPLLLNAELAEKYFKSKEFDQKQLEKFWHDAGMFKAFGEDPYIEYFWPKCPAIEEYVAYIEELYSPVFQSVKTLRASKAKSNTQVAK